MIDDIIKNMKVYYWELSLIKTVENSTVMVLTNREVSP